MTGVRYYHVFYLISGFLRRDPVRRRILGHSESEDWRVVLADRNFGSRVEAAAKTDLPDNHATTQSFNSDGVTAVTGLNGRRLAALRTGPQDVHATKPVEGTTSRAPAQGITMTTTLLSAFGEMPQNTRARMQHE